MFEQLPPNRRRFICQAIAISSLGGVAAIGCGGTSETESSPPPANRRDVPLRVLLIGGAADAEVLRTAWLSIAEQSLAITTVDAKTIPVEQFDSEVASKMAACDIAIVAAGLLATIDLGNLLTEPSEPTLGNEGIASDSLLPVLREGLMRFGGRTVGVPLGAVQPVVAISGAAIADGISAPRDWVEFIALAKSMNAAATEATALAAEPLAGGAAAKMFLWRASNARPPVWLFERESLAPVIDTQPYVETLETMKQCAEQYGDQRLTAAEVWSRCASGRLSMAITWPAIAHEADKPGARIEQPTDCQFSPLPVTRRDDPEPLQTLIDVDSPIALISTHCRQSETARRFLVWLAGDDGTRMLRHSINGFTELRIAIDATISPPTAEAELADDYATVLDQRLSSLAIRTTPQLIGYRRYIDALDQGVLDCLDSKSSAEHSLAEVAKQWSKLHAEIGIKEQSTAWRKAQGLRT